MGVDYLQYVYNLKGGSRFERFGNQAKDAITFHYVQPLEDQNTLQRSILKESDEEVLGFISEYLDLDKYYSNIIFTTDQSSYTDDVNFNHVRAIINFRMANLIQRPNKLFRAVNTLLPDAGLYIGRLETYTERKEHLIRKYGGIRGYLLWLADFMVNRVIPRIPYLEELYYALTKGQFHLISKAEVMGRLAYCGFETIDFKVINDISYFMAVKTDLPKEHQHPSFYPIIKLMRVGKGGKMIGVYKLRTMVPYSEYLQDYFFNTNGYDEKGKLAMDYRITKWGRILRRFWIDELPQLVNVLKGEMKLVGLRPLSLVRYNQFPDDLKAERIKYKPGCIPPYVALNMPDDKMNIEAERIYIRDLHKNPRTTDIRYFFRAIRNILANKIRSC
jgi:lipopolysaccharide/colanic/teichoic acid biosynthesis glycosyltransferase